MGEEAARWASVVVAVQGDAAEIARAAGRSGGPEVIFVADAARAIDEVSARLRPGDLVLVKGSRGVLLDTVVNALMPPEPTR